MKELPGITTLRTYKHEWLKGDLKAGIILSALLIPAGMGYAQAAGLPPVTGLYSTIVPLIAYAIFGPSRILVLGPDSSLAPIIAAAIVPLAAGSPERAVALAGLLAIMVGVILILGGFLRFGSITEFLSKPIRVGYLNGVAVVVLISQTPKLLGFSIEEENPLLDIATIIRNLDQVVPLAFAFGIASLATILLFRLLHARIPGVLIAVIGSILVVWMTGVDNQIPVVGALPQGLPAPALHGLTMRDVVELAAPAFGLALIAFADTGVLSRAFAARQGTSVNGSQEMTAIGISNVASGLFGGFPISASSSRTPVAEQAGARTQLASVIGALIVLAFMLIAPNLTAYLPSASLAAVVMVAAASLLDVKGSAKLWRMSPVDGLVSVAAFLGVLLWGVLEGILIALALAIFAFIRQARLPYRTELGRVEGIRGYHDLTRHSEGKRIPGTVIVRFDAPLFFANGALFDDYIRSVVEQANTEVHTVILAAEPITDIDTTAADELIELDDWLTARGIRLVIAEMKGPVKDKLHRFGLHKRFGPKNFAPTVGAAVDEITDAEN